MEKLNKNWKKLSDSQYELWIQNQLLGSLQLDFSNWSRKATFHTPQGTFYLDSKGFWQNKIQIEDQNQQVVLEVIPEKWYANYWTILVGTEKYKLTIRNNPLSEYVISKDGQEIIGYGLDAPNSKKIVTKITHSVEHTHIHFLFDYLLWYLFLPIAHENGADTFLLLVLPTTA